MTSTYLVQSTDHDHLVKWLRMNDVDPGKIPYGSDLEVTEHEGDWVIRFSVYATTPGGQYLFEDGEWRTASHTMPLLFDPPMGWLTPWDDAVLPVP